MVTRIGWSANNKIYTTIYSDDKKHVMVFKINSRNQRNFVFTTMLFDETLRPHVKERGELHPIVARNPWLFGDEFALSVDNRSLTEVLRKHQKMLGGGIQIDQPFDVPK